MLSQIDDVFKVIPEVPQMQPTAAVRSTIDIIASSQRQIQIANAELKELSDLQPPPQLTVTNRLEQWVEAWQQNHQTMATSEARLTALSNLQTPPKIIATDVLSDTIDLLESQQRCGMALDQQLDVISSLPELPQLQSAQPLRVLIEQYDELLANLDQQTKLVDVVNESIAKMETEIENWLGENPQCPTCGGEITKDQILEKSGGHVHA